MIVTTDRGLLASARGIAAEGATLRQARAIGPGSGAAAQWWTPHRDRPKVHCRELGNPGGVGLRLGFDDRERMHRALSASASRRIDGRGPQPRLRRGVPLEMARRGAPLTRQAGPGAPRAQPDCCLARALPGCCLARALPGCCLARGAAPLLLGAGRCPAYASLGAAPIRRLGRAAAFFRAPWARREFRGPFRAGFAPSANGATPAP